ncbi:MAG TPA: phage head-tail connector protein [Stellaceae bacterium]|nr:phage head-tail connector protein [Stellaceae bacterium]
MAFGDLCALADVKAWLQTGQNAFPDTDDALLTRLITAASQFIQTWLNRQIAPGDWQEVRDGSGGQRLAFANFPVTAVLSLSIDGLAITPAPEGGGYGVGYVFSPTELSLRGYVFTRRAQNVIVSYTAGYATTPPDVAQACIELVCQRYRERTRIGEVSRALAGRETVGFSQQDMSDDVKLLLSQYRAQGPVSGFARTLAATATDPALMVAGL